MRFRVLRRYRRMLLALTMLVVYTGALRAQAPSAKLRGQVADPTGAVIPRATISIKGPHRRAKKVKSDDRGQYEVHGLAPGKYTVSVTVPGFSAFAKDVDIAAGQEMRIDAPLEISSEPICILTFRTRDAP